MALGVGAFVGAGLPLGELWLDCRRPESDACLWGRALLGVSLATGLVLGALAGLIVYFAARARLSRSADGVSTEPTTSASRPE